MTLFGKISSVILFLVVFVPSIFNLQAFPKSFPSLRSRSAEKITPIVASAGSTCKLKCPTKSFKVQWYINDRTLNHTTESDKFTFKRRNRKEILVISNVVNQDGGEYSCVVDGIRRRSWMVIVKQDKRGKCREKRRARDLPDICSHAPDSDQQYNLYCDIWPLNFTKCKSFAGDPNDIKVIQYLQNGKQTPYIQIGWKEPKTGNSDLWGYEVKLLGYKGDASRQYCAQIFKKKHTYWTFTGELLFGAEYRISLRSLPSNNYHNEKIVVKEKCQFDKFKKSSICCNITNVNTTLLADNGTIHLLWNIVCPDSNLILRSSVIFWHNQQMPDNSKCIGKTTVSTQNSFDGTFSHKLRLSEECRKFNYTIKIYGQDNKNEITERGVRIVVAFPEVKALGSSLSPSSTSQSTTDDDQMKILVGVFGGLLGLALFVAIIVYKLCFQKITVTLPTKEGDSDTGLLDIQGPPKKVLLMHARCCVHCDCVINLLGAVLNETNAVETRVDFWHEQEIAVDRMRWYGMEVQNADHVVILASNRMRTLYQDGNVSDNHHDLLPIIAQLNFVAGEISQQPNSSKFISAYFSYNGGQTDVPQFLNSRLAHKLPQDLDRLIFQLLNIKAIQPHRTQTIAVIGGSTDFKEKKRELNSAIDHARNHHMIANPNNLVQAVDIELDQL